MRVEPVSGSDQRQPDDGLARASSVDPADGHGDLDVLEHLVSAAHGEDAAAATTGTSPEQDRCRDERAPADRMRLRATPSALPARCRLGDQQRQRDAEQEERGIAGSRKRKNAPLSTDASIDEPFRTKNPQNQTRDKREGTERRATAIAPANGSHWSTRMLQNTSRRLARLSPDVVPVDVDVLLVGRRQRVRCRARRWPPARRRRADSRSLGTSRAQRERPRSERGRADEELAPAAGGEQGDGRRGEEDEVRRLDDGGEARGSPATRRRAGVAALDRAEREYRRQEHEDRARVVRHRRQPERQGQELVDVAIVIAVDEERDCRRTARASRAAEAQ